MDSEFSSSLGGGSEDQAIEDLPGTSVEQVIEDCKLGHQSEQKCCNNDEEHKSTEKYSDYGLVCSSPADHEANHSSKVNKNKNQCTFRSTETELSRKMLTETDQKLSAEQSVIPELSEPDSVRKESDHVHLVPCKAESLRLRSSDRSHNNHLDEPLFSSLEGEKKEEMNHDLVQCSSNSTVPPVKSKNSKILCVLLFLFFIFIGILSAYHLHSEVIQSKDNSVPLVPSDSKLEAQDNPENPNNSDNLSKTDNFRNPEILKKKRCQTFRYTEEKIINYDIIFIIDSTGSMGGSFPLLKETINKILDSWKTATSASFGVVAYTDHYPNNAHYSGENPVGIYPPNGRLQTSNIEECIKFINNMRANGGGGNGGEAMIDGIKAANSLKFREQSNRIYILIADDTPHGSEFGNQSAYPRGCPCGSNWKNLIQTMKNNNVDFIFCQLNQSLSKTFELFNREFGGNIRRTMMNELKNLVSTVSLEVSKIIEKDIQECSME